MDPDLLVSVWGQVVCVVAVDYEADQRGVDPDLLAAQLEEMKSHMSPGVSPTSSQQDPYLTPSISTSASSEQTDNSTPVAAASPHTNLSKVTARLYCGDQGKRCVNSASCSENSLVYCWYYKPVNI